MPPPQVNAIQTHMMAVPPPDFSAPPPGLPPPGIPPPNIPPPQGMLHTLC